MDINYEDGSDSKISPPLKFLSKQFLTKLVFLCKKDAFLIAANILCYSDKAKEELLSTVTELLNDLSKQELQSFYIQVDDGNNLILFIIKTTKQVEEKKTVVTKNKGKKAEESYILDFLAAENDDPRVKQLEKMLK